MRYTEEKSREFLERMQKKMDDTGKTIAFTDLFIKTNPPSISHVIGTALNMRGTTTHGKKFKKEQKIRYSRSMQDMYLLVKHYFPKATIFDVVKDLQDRRNKDELYALFCKQHSKMMFRKTNKYYGCDSRDLSHYGIK